jgi:hypothetical protein
MQLSCVHGPSVIPPSTKHTAETEDARLGQPPAQLGNPFRTNGHELVKARKTPELPQRIETMSDTALVAYLDSLQYDTDPANSELVLARCVHTDPTVRPCALHEGANVYIQPDVGTHRWGKDTIPPFGFVVARITNYDSTDRREAGFGFPPNTRVWWVVDHDAVGRPRSRFFKRNYSPTAPAVDFVAQRQFKFCHHWSHNPQEASSKFKSCATSPTAMAGRREETREAMPTESFGARFRFASFRSAVPLPAAPHDDVSLLTDAWITCHKGCCATM